MAEYFKKKVSENEMQENRNNANRNNTKNYHYGDENNSYNRYNNKKWVNFRRPLDSADVNSNWKHDLYIENNQKPKTEREICDKYGFNVRDLSNRHFKSIDSNRNHEYKEENYKYYRGSHCVNKQNMNQDRFVKEFDKNNSMSNYSYERFKRTETINHNNDGNITEDTDDDKDDETKDVSSSDGCSLENCSVAEYSNVEHDNIKKNDETKASEVELIKKDEKKASEDELIKKDDTKASEDDLISGKPRYVEINELIKILSQLTISE